MEVFTYFKRNEKFEKLYNYYKVAQLALKSLF